MHLQKHPRQAKFSHENSSLGVFDRWCELSDSGRTVDFYPVAARDLYFHENQGSPSSSVDLNQAAMSQIINQLNQRQFQLSVTAAQARTSAQRSCSCLKRLPSNARSRAQSEKTLWWRGLSEVGTECNNR